MLVDAGVHLLFLFWQRRLSISVMIPVIPLQYSSSAYTVILKVSYSRF